MLNTGGQRIYLHRRPVDMRKGFRGLSLVVESEFSQSLLDGGLFVFVNRRKNLLKILYWDGDGLALWYKRLERGSFNFSTDGKTELSRRDFSLLLEGIEPRRLRKRYSLER